MTATFSSQLWKNLEGNKKRIFLITPDRNYRYKDLVLGIRCWLAMFDAQGLDVGDRLVLRTGRDMTAISGFIACLVDGVVPVLLEAGCPDKRLSSIVSSVDPKLVVSDHSLPFLGDEAIAKILSPEREISGLNSFLGGKNVNNFGLEITPTARKPRLPIDDTLAYLLFTSGTTADPTAVEITRANLVAQLKTLTRLGKFTKESRIFNDMSLAHVDGLIQGPILSTWNDISVIRPGGFKLENLEFWLSLVRRFRATHVFAVPTVWTMIEKFAQYNDYFDGDECEILVTTAGKMPEDLWRSIERRFGRPLKNYYGMTETVACALYAGDCDEMGAWGTIGKPVDCEARIDGDLEEGELQLKGSNIFSGYWRNPQRTNASFTDDGWFKTGDIVRHQKTGDFDYLGRIKTAINPGGFLILPDEIDEALLSHPAVLESVTVGMDDNVFGEIAVTGVVLSYPVEEAILVKHLRKHVEERKVPKRILSIDKIPRGLSGKAKTQDLRILLNRSKATTTVGEDNDVALAVLRIAAKVFRTPLEELSVHSAAETVEGWDSFTQLNLLLSVEEYFKFEAPTSKVSTLRSLKDFINMLQDVK